MATTLFPDIQTLALTDARDYDPAAEPGNYIAVWDPSDRSDVENDTRNLEFVSFARAGVSAEAAKAATEADLKTECVDPATGSFRMFVVRAES